MDIFRRFALLTLLLAPLWAQAETLKSAPWVGEDLGGIGCGGQGQGYGPYDYTNPLHRAKKLHIVEQYHYTKRIIRLDPSRRPKDHMGDLDYTLRAFPNHHRALSTVIRLYQKLLQQNPGRSPGQIGRSLGFPPPECYLQRAQRFAPNDGALHVLSGIYLHRIGKLEQAEAAYRQGVEMLPNSAEANYNLGLLLTDMNKHAEAIPFARKAYQLGYPLPALKRRILGAGLTLDP